MKQVYFAENAIDANFVKILLAEQQISSWIHGEHLISGLGELPAHGLVRVMVADSDYQCAREAVLDWQTNEANDQFIDPEPELYNENPSATMAFSLLIFIISLTLASIYALLN